MITAATWQRAISMRFDFFAAPLSGVGSPLVAGAAYVAVCAALHACRDKLAFETRRLQAAHNLLLCAASLVMTIGTARELVRRVQREAEGPAFLFCEHVETQPVGPLFFWSYLYYLSKYWEMLDTVLQLLKGRPPPHFVLHVYHHACVPLMAWAWLRYAQTLHMIGLVANTSVHVLMYYYYYRRVLGLPVRWKRRVTQVSVSGCAFTDLSLTLTHSRRRRSSSSPSPSAAAR